MAFGHARVVGVEDLIDFLYSIHKIALEEGSLMFLFIEFIRLNKSFAVVVGTHNEGGVPEFLLY